jgi:dTDP-4-amino-4,6-dideoxygalactose transaminase
MNGNGPYSLRCQKWLEAQTGAAKALLTPSCTDALEMAALLARLEPGDEVIMPSFTFSSTANRVVLRGATPVFVDIRPDTQNIDEKLIEGAITKTYQGHLSRALRRRWLRDGRDCAPSSQTISY